MKYLITLIIALLICAPCMAESLEVTSTPAKATVKRGEIIAMSVSLKNVLVPRDPVTITAEAQWEDEYGAAQTSTASATISIVQPVKVNRYAVAIPASFDSAQDMLFDFVAGSAKVDGQPIAPDSQSGHLVFNIGRTLNESESISLEYSFRAL